MDKIIEEAGALHGMVVNAGRTNHKSALDFTTEEIEALFSVNVSLKQFFLSQLLVWAYWLDGISSLVHSTQLDVLPEHSSN